MTLKQKASSCHKEGQMVLMYKGAIVPFFISVLRHYPGEAGLSLDMSLLLPSLPLSYPL